MSLFDSWNRRLHYYFGLYFLFFLWLFSLTGLLLNHQQWFAGTQRSETKYEMPIETPAGDTLLAQTQDVMRQLELKGEIDWPGAQPAAHIDFNVSRPSDAAVVRVDLNAKTAYIRRFDNQPKLTFQVFHTFSGAKTVYLQAQEPNTSSGWVQRGTWTVP